MTQREGWALTDQRLDWTDDGGRTWRGITPPGIRASAIGSVFFLDRDHGWVAGYAGHTPASGPQAVTVFRTIDGGTTWRSIRLPGSVPDPDTPGPPNLYFADSGHGWNLQDTGSHGGFNYGELFRTVDGGALWTRLPVPYPTSGLPIPETLSFLTSSVGWLPATVRLYTTENGGVTWRTQTVPPPTGYAARDVIYAYAPRFFGPDEGVLPVALSPRPYGEPTSLAYYVTADQGRTWTLRSVMPVFEECGDATQALDVVDLRNWLAFVPRPPNPHHSCMGWQLAVTRDGGRTWQTIGSHNLLFASELSFIDPRNGWALADIGGCGHFKPDCYSSTPLMATNDGGRTWQELSPP